MAIAFALGMRLANARRWWLGMGLVLVLGGVAEARGAGRTAVTQAWKQIVEQSQGRFRGHDAPPVVPPAALTSRRLARALRVLSGAERIAIEGRERLIGHFPNGTERGLRYVADTRGTDYVTHWTRTRDGQVWGGWVTDGPERQVEHSFTVGKRPRGLQRRMGEGPGAWKTETIHYREGKELLRETYSDLDGWRRLAGQDWEVLSFKDGTERAWEAAPPPPSWTRQ